MSLQTDAKEHKGRRENVATQSEHGDIWVLKTLLQPQLKLYVENSVCFLKVVPSEHTGLGLLVIWSQMEQLQYK